MRTSAPTPLPMNVQGTVSSKGAMERTIAIVIQALDGSLQIGQKDSALSVKTSILLSNLKGANNAICARSMSTSLENVSTAMIFMTQGDARHAMASV